MSMSMNIVGIVPPDDRWRKMKALAVACDAAAIDWPDEVYEYFEVEDVDDIDPAGMEISLESAREWGGDECGYEIDVADIPAKVKTIRVYNSW